MTHSVICEVIKKDCKKNINVITSKLHLFLKTLRDIREIWQCPLKRLQRPFSPKLAYSTLLYS